LRRRGVSPSSAAWPLCRDLASGRGQRLWISIAGSSSIRRLKDVAIVMDLHELAPAGRRAARRRDRRRLERFAEVREGLRSHGLSHPGLLPLANLRFKVSRLLPAVSSESDVAATPEFDFCSCDALEGTRRVGRGCPRPVAGRSLCDQSASRIGARVPFAYSDADRAAQSLLRLSVYAGSRGMGTPSRDRIPLRNEHALARRHRFHAAMATACSRSRARLLEPLPLGAGASRTSGSPAPPRSE